MNLDEIRARWAPGSHVSEKQLWGAALDIPHLLSHIDAMRPVVDAAVKKLNYEKRFASAVNAAGLFHPIVQNPYDTALIKAVDAYEAREEA